jgi:hypothetical protein
VVGEPGPVVGDAWNRESGSRGPGAREPGSQGAGEPGTWARGGQGKELNRLNPDNGGDREKDREPAGKGSGRRRLLQAFR